MEHAKRFRALLADLGLTHPEAAKLLHVSLRTLQNWLTGRHAVPYATLKLLRLMRYMELPGQGWQGWHFSRGQLVTPEGRTIGAGEGAWWSLLVRRSAAFGELYAAVQRSAAVQREAVAALTTRRAEPQADRAARSAANLLLEHFGTGERRNGVNSPSFAINSIAQPSHDVKGVIHGWI